MPFLLIRMPANALRMPAELLCKIEREKKWGGEYLPTACSEEEGKRGKGKGKGEGSIFLQHAQRGEREGGGGKEEVPSVVK